MWCPFLAPHVPRAPSPRSNPHCHPWPWGAPCVFFQLLCFSGIESKRQIPQANAETVLFSSPCVIVRPCKATQQPPPTPSTCGHHPPQLCAGLCHEDGVKKVQIKGHATYLPSHGSQHRTPTPRSRRWGQCQAVPCSPLCSGDGAIPSSAP